MLVDHCPVYCSGSEFELLQGIFESLVVREIVVRLCGKIILDGVVNELLEFYSSFCQLLGVVAELFEDVSHRLGDFRQKVDEVKYHKLQDIV